MLPGVNKRQMEQAMRRLGMKQQEIEAEEVVIRTAEYDIIISQPSVAKVEMMGQTTFQISGNIKQISRNSTNDEPSYEMSKEDIETVMAQTGADEEKATMALKESKGDIALAIISLNNS